jgi:uncharacterized membrane protein YkoI
MRTIAHCVAIVLMLGHFPPAPAPAAAQARCLSESEQRQEVRSREVVRPGRLRRQLGGTVLDMRLCRDGGGLVWRATVLRPNGRVVHRRVDARTGRIIR